MNVTIDRLENRYFIAAGADPERLRMKLDEVALTGLTSAMHDEAFETSDDRILFIPEMTVNVDLAVSDLDEGILAKRWAERLQHAIVKELGRLPHGVITYSNRSEFVAAFVQDLLHGQAWTHPQYGEFAGLRSLSKSAAIERVLTADGDIGRDALGILARRKVLDLLFVVLTESDAETITLHCLLPASPRAASSNTPAWISTIQSQLSLRRFDFTASIYRNTSRLYLEAIVDRPELGPDSSFARFIRDLFMVMHSLVQGNVHELTRIVARQGAHVLQRSIAGRPAQQALSMLCRQGPPQEIAVLIHAALQAVSQSAVERRALTQFGGLFMLVPAMLDANVWEQLGPDNTNVRLKELCALCVDRSRREEARRDSGVALLAGLPETVKDGKTCDERSEDLAPISTDLLTRFGQRLGAFSESTPSYLSRNFLECEAFIHLFPERIDVQFLTCPLQVVVRMAGFEGPIAHVPWLNGRRLVLHYE